MEWIDTHTHLYLPEFDEDRHEMIRRAREAGVSACYLPNIDPESIESLLALESEVPDLCHAMMGLHPCSVDARVQDSLDQVRHWLEKRPFAAVGEIGLDRYWEMAHYEQQVHAFRTQLRWAKEFKRPVVIHSRDALDECIALVREEKTPDLRGVFHCFSGTPEQVQAVTELDFFMGIGGVLTYKKAGLDVLLPLIPRDRIVLETDAPYLSPVPFRGKRNESAYLVRVAERMAEILGMTLEEVARLTTENARRLFA